MAQTPATWLSRLTESSSRCSFPVWTNTREDRHTLPEDFIDFCCWQWNKDTWGSWIQKLGSFLDSREQCGQVLLTCLPLFIQNMTLNVPIHFSVSLSSLAPYSGLHLDSISPLFPYSDNPLSSHPGSYFHSIYFSVPCLRGALAQES